MVTELELEQDIRAPIAVSWKESGSWAEIEVSGRFLDMITFRHILPGRKPVLPLQGLDNILDVPKAFLDVYNLNVDMRDIERAVIAYRRRRVSNEGHYRVQRFGH